MAKKNPKKINKLQYDSPGLIERPAGQDKQTKNKREETPVAEKKKNGLREKILPIVQRIEKIADEAHEKEIWDSALDIVETIIEHSKTKIDDWFIMPLIRILRRRLNIPDND